MTRGAPRPSNYSRILINSNYFNISIHPEKESEITKVKNDLEKWIEQKIKELLSGTKFEVIPIQKL